MDTQKHFAPKIQNLAEILRQAQKTQKACAPLNTDKFPLTVDEAYAIQLCNIEAKLGGNFLQSEEQIVGHKIGLTSKAIQNWLKVEQPDFGHLLSGMLVKDPCEISCKTLLQPRIEGEIAFILKKDLRGPGLTHADIIAATDFVLPALEIIDSRIIDWKISYEDTIADNASSAMFVLGTKASRLIDLNLSLLGMKMYQNNTLAATGAGAACLGNPINSVLWLANNLGKYGQVLKAGQVILSGALGPVANVKPGDFFDLEIANLGSVAARFVD